MRATAAVCASDLTEVVQLIQSAGQTVRRGLDVVFGSVRYKLTNVGDRSVLTRKINGGLLLFCQLITLIQSYSEPSTSSTPDLA